jgi:RNA polymerase sigma-70 factor (ECF subfamily)
MADPVKEISNSKEYVSEEFGFVGTAGRPQNNNLVRKLKAGDASAFASVYDTYSRPIYGLIFRMVRNGPLAEDLLQEVFVKLWKSASLLDDGAVSVGPWLAAVARHHVLDYLKSGENQRNMRSASLDFRELASYISIPGYDAAFAERARLLRNKIGRLEARQQQVLELAYFQGMTQSEMAAALSLPLGTVKSCMRGALRDLKNSIDFGPRV